MKSEALTREYLEKLQKKLYSRLASKEYLYLNLAGETSQFIRVNGAKIRQIGTVSDASLCLTFVFESAPGTLHKSERSLTLSGISYLDDRECQSALEFLQRETRDLPADAYAQIPENRGQSVDEKRGRLLPFEDAPDALLGPVGGLDLAGIYAAGICVRAMSDSAGTFHWFSSDSFSFDYSIYTPGQRAVKGTYAGTSWDSPQFSAQIQAGQRKLELLLRPAKKLDRGDYRVFLEAPAFSDLIDMFSWEAVSEAAIRQGDSPLQKLRTEKARFSPIFSLSEDFRGGESPRFNSEGELAPEHLVIFEGGTFKNSLVSTRTSLEYGAASNFASEDETLRAPCVAPGDLREADVLKRLDTGLYLSNLHYLNWSDQPEGRVTGMTRFACFWVENGQMVCPIENMRFDDTIFRFFGESLEALTQERMYLPSTSTYEARDLGGSWIPGALLSGMRFTI